ncbi:MAG: YqgE/AlgH family protein [Bacteroidetes bacterium]|jgi:putative transcriptional regulator|nr:YqgE/AlgH family protein [Bacteroidota bacterium]MBT4412363.1 YqgE/AlgH family protein [Bacteroidota bacterium]MBT5426639.1 YqgE/AlgH family protein [Bacteroidota bacterium]MBT7092460.1 YqgE/AlgH family protein [Bacteroidota bacterium]MBT7462933.1 YqgE/AlgH family protein [Bacteroidota bacterium]
MDESLDFFKIEHNDILPDKGRVLVSEPFLQDEYFKRSVVLITEHNDEGTLGFVLNNPINYDASDILKDFPAIDAMVGIGGPVRTDTVHYIHSMGDQIPESVHVLGSVFWGGDFEMVRMLIEAGELDGKSIRFFVGFSSWYPGQLAREISENSWLVTTLDPKSVMTGKDNQLWKKVLLNEERKYQMWTRYPEDPLMN